MNLLNQFVLQHIQVSVLRAELTRVSAEPGSREARVELNLTPRPIKADSGEQLPAYQVSARLSCHGGEADQPGPQFLAEAGYEVIYQQIKGDAVDLADFTANHASLTRQIYPLLQNELRVLLGRLGLEQIHLPYDLAARVQDAGGQTVQVSGALH